MSRGNARPWVWIACVSIIASAWVAPVSARDAAVDRQVRELKALHREILLSGAARKLDFMKAAARRKPRRLSDLVRSRPPRDRTEALGPQGVGGLPAGLRVVSDGLPIPINLRIHDGASLTTQSEVTLAASGAHVVAAWNDGRQIPAGPAGIGYSFSSDGGRTWTDGGPAPRTAEVAVWVSDPVLAVDPARGFFYLAGLVIAAGPRNGVAVARGRFVDGVLQWEPPRIARGTRDTLPDKPWFAADSLTGNLFLSYTSFFRRDGQGSDQIEFQRSGDSGETWSPAVKLSPDAENGLVQGSRPVVGPDGEVHVVWKTIDTTAAAGGLDVMRIRTSRDAGRTFGPAVTVAGLYTNFCTGPPGFDRGFGLGFPSIAVDRSAGPRRGRVYVSWEESLNFYDDLTSTGGEALEQEPNGTFAAATPFVIGAALRGAVGAAQDVDWYRFTGVQGQTAMIVLDSLDARLDVALRVWCGDGHTRLAFSAPLTARRRVVLCTLPRTGDYLVSVAPLDDSTGAYRLATGLASRGAERGRDQRDVFAAYSDDGVTWSVPARVNDGAPRYDDWLPELATASDGQPFVLWYDWRDGDPAGCGAASTPRLARSDDGGNSWLALGPTADYATLWSDVFNNLSPNMGDYIALTAGSDALLAAWADGRGGTPDAFVAPWALPSAAEHLVGGGSEPEDGGVRVRWRAPKEVVLTAAVYRRRAGEEWTTIGMADAAGGTIELLDSAVEPGFRYHYRLGIATTSGEVGAAEQAVDVPSGGAPTLAIERLGPNPSAGALRVQFLRPDLGPARIEILDLGGRRVFARDLGEDFGVRGTIDLGREVRLKPGLYVVRLVQSARAVTAKVMVLE